MNLNQLTLYITKSPEEYTGGKHIEMPESGGSLGRNPSNTLSLIDHNRFISGSHCLISVYGDTYYLSDVSTNGTLVNGNKLLKNQPISLYDGDNIVLGRYEVSVGLEKLSNTVNIAADITTESDSTDPLLNLAEYKDVTANQTGSVEDLFIETRQDDIDTQDPVTHLNFTLKDDDDFLLSEHEEKAQHHVPEYAPSRQLLDDSDSVHSEFHMPNMIPEDWLSSDLSAEPKPMEQLTPETVFNAPDPAPQTVQAAPTQQSWEEVTQTIQTQHASAPQEPAEKKPEPAYYSGIEPSQHAMVPQINTNSSNDHFKDAFFKGLGISEAQFNNIDTHFFQQMGTCLRLCINDLQKDLSEIKAIKDTEQDTPLTNIVELMLSLNQQQLLSPNELIEQILDELDSHKIKMSQATNEIVNQQIQAFDPRVFSNNLSSQSRFMPKRKLWKEYIDFYHKNNIEKVDISGTALQQKIKEQYSKNAKV